MDLHLGMGRAMVAMGRLGKQGNQGWIVRLEGFRQGRASVLLVRAHRGWSGRLLCR